MQVITPTQHPHEQKGEIRQLEASEVTAQRGQQAFPFTLSLNSAHIWLLLCAGMLGTLGEHRVQASSLSSSSSV